MGASHPVDRSLLVEAVQAFREHGEKKSAAESLNLPVSTFKHRLKIAARAGVTGDFPEYDLTHPAAPGMVVKGTSTLYDANGQVQGQWSKTKQEGRDPDDVVKLADPKVVTKVSTLYDQEGRVAQQWVAEKPSEIQRRDAWIEFAKEIAGDLPRLEPIIKPGHESSNLLAAFPVGDHHMGMLATLLESGEEWTIEKAESILRGAIDYLMMSTPSCNQALLAFLGDFMHYDSTKPVTPSHGNQLDADGRYPSMIRAAIRALRYAIETALRRHQKVHVIIEIGNHDLYSSVFLMECLANLYENEPRVTIDTSPQHYHYFRFGKVLIGTHHGHGAKPEQLPIVMATDRPKDWGETKHRYIWTGHVHHNSQRDIAGVDVESFRILPPEDAWAKQKGYRSIRDMKAIVFHSEYGEVARHVVKPEMLRL